MIDGMIDVLIFCSTELNLTSTKVYHSCCVWELLHCTRRVAVGDNKLTLRIIILLLSFCIHINANDNVSEEQITFSKQTVYCAFQQYIKFIK